MNIYILKRIFYFYFFVCLHYHSIKQEADIHFFV